jgi:hypothetical protein
VGVEFALPFGFQDLNAFEGVSGTPTFSTSSLRSGGGDAKMICAAAGAVTRVAANHAAGKRVLVESFYYLQTGAPSANGAIYQAANASGNASVTSVSTAGGGGIAANAAGNLVTASAALTNNTWYRVDVRVVVSGGVMTVTVWLNGVQLTQSTATQTDADLTASRLGISTAVTLTSHYMDHSGSYTVGDAPLGEYRGRLYDLAAAVGANHSLGSGSFQKTGAVAITSGDSNSQAELTEKPFSMTQYVAQTAIASTAYVEYPVADSSEQSPPSLVRVGSAWAGSAANAYLMEIRAYDGTTESSDLTSASSAAKTGTTTRIPVPAYLLTAPSGAAWTNALFNALRLRFGFSGDATPNPRLGALAVWAVHRVPVLSTGAFSLSQTDSLSVTGAVTRLGAFSLAQTDVLSVTGTLTRTGAFSLSQSDTLAVTGVVTRLGAFGLTAFTSLDDSGTVTRFGVLSLTGSTLLEATGVVTRAGAFSLTQSDSLIVTGARTRLGAFSLAAQTLLEAAGTVSVTGAFSLVTSTLLEADGVAFIGGAFSLTAGPSLSMTGVREVLGGFDLVTPDPVPPVVIVEQGGGGAIIRIDVQPVILGAAIFTAHAVLTAGGVVEGKVDDEEEAIRLALTIL